MEYGIKCRLFCGQLESRDIVANRQGELSLINLVSLYPVEEEQDEE